MNKGKRVLLMQALKNSKKAIENEKERISKDKLPSLEELISEISKLQNSMTMNKNYSLTYQDCALLSVAVTICANYIEDRIKSDERLLKRYRDDLLPDLLSISREKKSKKEIEKIL